MMRPLYFVFAALLALLAIIMWIVTLPVPTDAVGLAHPRFPAMKIGGDGASRLAEVGNLPYVMQVIVLMLAIGLIALGVHPKRRSTVFWLALMAVAAAYQFVWWNIWFSYQDFLRSGTAHYFLGFTTPTAWMIFGIWLSGIGLLAIYVVGFRRFVFTHQDEAAYNELMHEQERVVSSTEESAL